MALRDDWRRRWGSIPAGARLAAALVLTAAVSITASVAWMSRGPAPITDADVAAAVASGASAAARSAAAQPPDAAVAWQTIAQSLVSITTSTGEQGAGVIVRDDGSILTSAAVVATGTVTVRFADGTTTTAKVASTDAASDTALLTPAELPTPIVPATLGGAVAVGSPVFAVGDPVKLVGSLTAGVVSGLDRSVPVTGREAMAGLIQFDAAVNPGTAGGPLLDRQGRVVGIITRVPNPSGQTWAIGVGFAVPITSAGGGGRQPPQ